MKRRHQVQRLQRCQGKLKETERRHQQTKPTRSELPLPMLGISLWLYAKSKMAVTPHIAAAKQSPRRPLIAYPPVLKSSVVCRCRDVRDGRRTDEECKFPVPVFWGSLPLPPPRIGENETRMLERTRLTASLQFRQHKRCLGQRRRSPNTSLHLYRLISLLRSVDSRSANQRSYKRYLDILTSAPATIAIMGKQTTVAIVGDGNAAHVLIPFLGGTQHTVNLLSLSPHKWDRTVRCEVQNMKHEVQKVSLLVIM